METRSIVVSVVVVLFGVASAILGFVAEATRLTAHDITLSRSGGCVYQAKPAFALALCALLLLAVAQIIASAAAGCCGCCRPKAGASSSINRGVGIVLSILSWVVAVIAGASYQQGAVWNAAMTRHAFDGRCYILRGGVFTRAAVLSLVATVLGVTSYILLTRAPAQAHALGAATTSTAGAETEPNKPDDGLDPPAVVGLPQWPAQGYGQAQNPQVAPPAWNILQGHANAKV